jgi:5-methylcytosine-specific restriction endonuclease McrA
VDVIGIWLAMGKRCAYCDLEMTEQPDPDHVVPLSRGGHNDIANILPCCHRCNSDKNDMTLGEWAADRARRGKDPRITDYATFDPRAPHLVLREAVGAPHRAAA